MNFCSPGTRYFFKFQEYSDFLEERKKVIEEQKKVLQEKREAKMLRTA